MMSSFSRTGNSNDERRCCGCLALLVISGGEEADRADNDAAALIFFVADVLVGDDVDGFGFVAFFLGVVSAAAGVVVCGGAVRFEDDHDGCQMDGGVVVAAAREDEEEEAALARRDDDEEEEVELLDVAAVDQEGWNIDDIEDTALIDSWSRLNSTSRREAKRGQSTNRKGEMSRASH